LNSEDTELLSNPEPAPAPTDYAPAPITGSFEPLNRAAAVPEVEEETWGGDAEGIRGAAEALTAQRSVLEQPSTVREYRHGNEGRHVELDKTVSIEDAATDLAAARRQEAEAIEALRNYEVAAEVDAMRAGLQGEQPAPVQPESQQPTLEPQATEPPPDPNETKLARMMREDSEFRGQIENLLGGIEQQKADARAQYEEAVGQYRQAAQVAAMQVEGFLQSVIPELADSASVEQSRGRMDVLARTNPTRHAEIMSLINRGHQAIAHYGQHLQQQQIAAQQQQAAQAEQAKQDFSRFAEQHDSLFEDYVKGESAETRRAVTERVPEILQRHYGIDPQGLAEMYRTNPLIRSSAFQRMAWDASRWHIAREALPRAIDRTAPKVQTPGTSSGPITRSDGDYGEASRQFRDAPSAKTGAALLAARRSARSR